MRKIAILIVFIMLVTSFTGIFSIKTSVADPTTIYVHPGESIQDAINSANPGDTIYVYNGIYQEQINVTKSVTLEGQNNKNTIIVGGFNVSQNNTIIKNFNITQGFQWISEGTDTIYKSGIYAKSSNNVFYNNHIWNIIGQNATGIFIIDSSSNNVTLNIISKIYAGDGVFNYNGGFSRGINIQSSTNNRIFDNSISDIKGGAGMGSDEPGGSGGEAIGIFINSSFFNDILTNDVANIIGGNGVSEWYSGKGGRAIGIYLITTENNTIDSNTFTNIFGGNAGESAHSASSGGDSIGILLHTSDSSVIKNNLLSNLKGGEGDHVSMGFGGSGGYSIGIFIDSSSQVTVSVNNLSQIISGNGGLGHGGGNACDSIGISILGSSTVNISKNNISKITGGNGGAASYAGGIGGNATGVFLHMSTSIVIHSNLISALKGGNGGHGDDYGCGGGGTAVGISTFSALSLTISSNNIYNLTGGADGTCVWGYLSSGDGIGIRIQESNSSNIKNNTISEIKGGTGSYSAGGNSIGIWLLDCFSNNISMNHLSDNNAGDGGANFDGCYAGGLSAGFYLQNSEMNMIFSNNISNIIGGDGGNYTGDNYPTTGGDGGDGVGIYLNISPLNNIIHNFVSNCFGGLRGVGETVNGTDGLGAGLYCIYSEENTIARSSFSNNEYGIKIESSVSNRCYHNNFINNIQNANDILTNSWYNETLREGNYWSDYTGIDNNGDGIGDTPYNIPGGTNKDLYPFMKKDGWTLLSPQADFSTLLNKLNVTFKDLSSDEDGNLVAWFWSFGDGNTSTQRNTTHAYAREGTYDVTLSVTDNDGLKDTQLKKVDVFIIADTEPPSKVTGLTVIDATNGKLNLAWNAAIDNIAVDHYKIYRNNVFLLNRTSTTYQDTGLTNGQSYSYKVSAVDTSGNEGNQSDSASGTPTASGGGGGGGGGGEEPPQNIKPVADASAGEPYQGYVNSEITFDGSKSHDPDGNITKWFWVFGDTTNGTGMTVNHTFSKKGTYIVTLTVTDNDGATNTDTTTCVIQQPNRPPTKPKITGPTSGMTNTTYNYTIQATDPDNDTIRYSITWGDQTSINNSSTFLPSGTSFTFNHRWTTPGQYIVLVTVTDNQTGSYSQITITIEVEKKDIPPTPGFELVFILSAMAVAILLWRKNRSV